MISRDSASRIASLATLSGHGNDMFVVEHSKRLEGRVGFASFVDELGGVGAIEGLHERLGLRADKKPVDRAAMGLGIMRICKMIFVVR